MNLGELLKQAKDIQERADALQNRIAAIEIAGESGGGLVRATLNGKGALVRLSIDPSLARSDQVTTIEDLVVAAHADAKTKLERRLAEEMKAMAGMLGLPPGLGLGV